MHFIGSHWGNFVKQTIFLFYTSTSLSAQLPPPTRKIFLFNFEESFFQQIHLQHLYLEYAWLKRNGSTETTLTKRISRIIKILFFKHKKSWD